MNTNYYYYYENELHERYKVICWLINGYGRTGIEITDSIYIRPEWIVNNYNVELSYFKDESRNTNSRDQSPGGLRFNPSFHRRDREEESRQIRHFRTNAKTRIQFKASFIYLVREGESDKIIKFTD